MKKVSIITATFNSEKTVKKTIDSILSQDYKNIEYIIMDGESSDSTVSIIESYKENITKFISERDNGIYDALNKGVRLASGDIIGFLHSDDFYADKSIISNVVQNFKDQIAPDIVIGNVTFVNEKNEIDRNYSGENFNFNIGIMPPHPSVFIKKRCYEKFGYFNTDYKIAADYDLLFRFLKIKKAKYLYSKNITVNMLSGGLSNKNIMSILLLNKEIYKIHQSHNAAISLLDMAKKIPKRIREIL